MKRLLYSKLVTWKCKKGRKPLMLHGVRQVGKTYLLKEFGSKEFGSKEFVSHHYLNFEKKPKFHNIFENDLDPIRILKDIEFELDRPVDIQNDLLIFDEIQACPATLTSLKYFCEELPNLALATAGSLLGLSMGGPSFL